MTHIAKPAELLNRECACRTLDTHALADQFGNVNGADFYPEILKTRPHLFSDTPVFISREDVNAIMRIIDAVEQVVALPAYQDQALRAADDIARRAFGPRGAFLGYDFHLGPAGPRVIEINTNAGGALLNAVLARAQLACCLGVDSAGRLPGLERGFFEMFLEEWRLQRGDAPLARVAIVDDAPATQYLYPEFVLFERLFTHHGVEAVIADAADLAFRDGALSLGGTRIDLVYNRLTDFALAEPRHRALREAYESGAVVVTPHPRAHALYADKRNLALLSDADTLRRWGVNEGVVDVLAQAIPRTMRVTSDNAERLWGERRNLFFKPTAGYGSKAAYRGDKITKRVFGEILAGDYVAQELVPPSERRTRIDDQTVVLKFDLRAYVYAGEVQLLAARLYQGQTTNFRTVGGGFAPVFYPSAVDGAEDSLREAVSSALGNG